MKNEKKSELNDLTAAELLELATKLDAHAREVREMAQKKTMLLLRNNKPEPHYNPALN